MKYQNDIYVDSGNIRKKISSRALIIAVVIFLSNISMAQDNLIQISGQVIDAGTKSPISEVSVQGQ